jgi:hypothetical protein
MIYNNQDDNEGIVIPMNRICSIKQQVMSKASIFMKLEK